MLNLHELERQWLRYKMKSYLPHFAILMSIVVILTVLSIFLHNSTKRVAIDKTIHKQVKIENKLIKPVVPIKPAVIIKRELQKEKPPKKAPQITSHDKQKMILSPSLGFMKKMQTEIQPYYKSKNNNVLPNKQKKVPKRAEVEKVKRKVPHEVKEEQPKHIRITREDTYSDIKEIIQRFNKNNNPALSLFIAKKYYELGNYREARNYALITNNLNHNIESSWIIFSKSLVKLGKRNKAIKTLQTYIGYSHSNSAKILLDEIRSGKFI